jgi:hypothetical protein
LERPIWGRRETVRFWFAFGGKLPLPLGGVHMSDTDRHRLFDMLKAGPIRSWASKTSLPFLLLLVELIKADSCLL